MSRLLLIPQFTFQNITDITLEFLNKQAIEFLMLDLDNTVAAYGQPLPSETVLQWAGRLSSNGIKLFVVSNSKRGARVESFAKALGADFIMRAGKPSPTGLRRAMSMAGRTAGSSALAGDQIFTDVLGANLAGVVSIIVNPIRLINPFHTFRYFLELPFRCYARLRSSSV